MKKNEKKILVSTTLHLFIAYFRNEVSLTTIYNYNYTILQHKLYSTEWIYVVE